jgi:hypothetical protein
MMKSIDTTDEGKVRGWLQAADTLLAYVEAAERGEARKFKVPTDIDIDCAQRIAEAAVLQVVAEKVQERLVADDNIHCLTVAALHVCGADGINDATEFTVGHDTVEEILEHLVEGDEVIDDAEVHAFYRKSLDQLRTDMAKIKAAALEWKSAGH